MKMRNTIKAKKEYIVKLATIKETKEEVRILYDGDNLIMVAQIADYEKDYLIEKEQNECFEKMEVFTARNGRQYIYWRDNEADIDYLTKVPMIKEGKKCA